MPSADKKEGRLKTRESAAQLRDNYHRRMDWRPAGFPAVARAPAHAELVSTQNGNYAESSGVREILQKGVRRWYMI